MSFWNDFRSAFSAARQASAAGTRDPSDDFWYQPVGGVSIAGESVTEMNARRVPAVSACLKALADPVATLPLGIYKRGKNGTRERDDEHPLADVLRSAPNDFQSAAEFRGQMQDWVGLHRNAYAEIRPGRRGAVDQLIPMHPDVVTLRKVNGAPWYDLMDGMNRRTLSSEEVWHLKMPPLQPNGMQAISALELGRDAIGFAIAVQNYGARLFRNDTRAGDVIEMGDHRFDSVEDRDRYIRAWQAARTGSNAGRTALLEFGMKLANHRGQTNDEAQFIETRTKAAIEVAQYWHMPPHKIGILDKATFSNIEQQALEFVIDTLMPWLVLWEQAINRDLIVLDRRYFAEFNVLGLLRGDIKSRFEAYSQARQWGWLSVDDIRRLENMNPLPGGAGEVYLQPMNMVPAGSDPAAMKETNSLISQLRNDIAGIAAGRPGPLSQPPRSETVAPFLSLRRPTGESDAEKERYSA